MEYFLILMFVLMIDETIRSGLSIESLSYIVILIFVYAVGLWLFKRYRSFVWYRTGKKGFVFLASSFLAFLLITGVMFWLRNKVALVILSLLLSLISLSILFILGEVFKPLSVNKRRRNETG